MNNQINCWIKEGLCTGECTAVHFPTVGNYNEFLVSFKGLMALVAFYGFKLLNKKTNNILSRIVSGFSSEVLMILCYFGFEGRRIF